MVGDEYQIKALSNWMIYPKCCAHAMRVLGVRAGLTMAGSAFGVAVLLYGVYFYCLALREISAVC